MEKSDLYTKEFLHGLAGNPDSHVQAESFRMILDNLASSFNLLHRAPSFFFVFDFTSMQYLFVSDSIFDLVGFTAAEWKAGGPDFSFSRVHPDDVARLKTCHNALFKHYHATPAESKKGFKYGYEVRWRTREDKYVWLLQQGIFLDVDKEGRPVVSFDVLSDLTGFKHDNILSLSVTPSGGEKTSMRFPLTGDLVLSNREIEILNLLCEGHSSQEIANKLFISPHTVKTHRRNMIRKASVNDTTALVFYAKRNGLI